jgi:hypothetical protein
MEVPEQVRGKLRAAACEECERRHIKIQVSFEPSEHSVASVNQIASHIVPVEVCLGQCRAINTRTSTSCATPAEPEQGPPSCYGAAVFATNTALLSPSSPYELRRAGVAEGEA